MRARRSRGARRATAIPASSEPLKKNPAVVAAVVAAISSIVVSGITTGTSVLVAQKEPQDTCVVVFEKYSTLVRSFGVRGTEALLLTPKADGKTPLEKDEAAARCGIDAAAIRELERLTP